ncbi:hypothetical protein KCU89_g11569, partial [Aureobasidium melanogenum]
GEHLTSLLKEDLVHCTCQLCAGGWRQRAPANAAINVGLPLVAGGAVAAALAATVAREEQRAREAEATLQSAQLLVRAADVEDLPEWQKATINEALERIFAALITTLNRPLKKTIKKVAFMPTLEDVHDSLSRKERRASLSSLSDHATMGTVDFYVETTSSCSSSISLLAEVGSSVCGSSVNDVSFRHSIMQTPSSHMRNVSDTAVFGDETTTTSEKEPHPWTVWGSEPHSRSVFTCRDSTRSLMNTSTTTATSLDAPMSHGAMISGSLNITAPDCASQADKVYDSRLLIKGSSETVNHLPTHITSCTHATSHSTKTSGYLNKTDLNKTWPTQPAASTSDSPSLDAAISFAFQSGGASPGTVRAGQSAEQHKCCIGVLSAFEAKFLNDEDKQAIL